MSYQDVSVVSFHSSAFVNVSFSSIPNLINQVDLLSRLSSALSAVFGSLVNDSWFVFFSLSGTGGSLSH